MIYYFREQISADRSGSRRAFRICAVALFFFVAAITSAAQSTDIELPTPVAADEIDGRIEPRDIGDARPTRYFYTFTGGPGDLLISVESANLEGNIDLFITSGLRPLAQVTLYSSGGTSLASKSVFLRREETLLLRIEARSPNDDPGTYRIRFRGAFTPSRNVAQTTDTTGETSNPAPIPAGRNTRRVTSVGGRIPESETQSTEEKKPETSETSPPVSPSSPGATPAPPTVAPTPAEKSEAATPTPAETERANRAAAPTDAGDTSKKKAEPGETLTPAPSESAPAPQPAGARLIIETKDNGLIERDMNNVRRVTIENGQIVIVLKNGEVERQSLANITRMSIVP